MNISEELIREIITKVVESAASEKKASDCGFGVMELDHTSFEWTLTYDEYDIVLEGTLEIEIDGRIVSGGPGDIIYIPKGSHIHFQTKDKCRYVYTVYPANWAE